MEEHLWKVLLIEDDEEDYILTREILSDAGGVRFHLEWASNYIEGQKALQNGDYDAILVDYELGQFTGLDLIRSVSGSGYRAPIILLTGRGNYQVDVEAMHSGATDYLAKSEVTPRLLERTIRYAIMRKQNEDALRAARDELELRVHERTQELRQKNKALQEEVQERLKVEAELAEVQRRLLDRAEAERRELARELHDGPMQELYGVIFAIGAVQDEQASEIKDKLLEIVSALRSISRELRPPALAPHGLQKAIQSHLEALQENYPTIEMNSNLMADGQTLPEQVRVVLFRIYQVSITNVIRHAQANMVDVRLLLDDRKVTLEVQDNGCGFSVPDRWIELARQGHLGLVGAAERAEAVGGKLQVESEIGKGSLIRVIAPIPRSLTP